MINIDMGDRQRLIPESRIEYIEVVGSGADRRWHLELIEAPRITLSSEPTRTSVFPAEPGRFEVWASTEWEDGIVIWERMPVMSWRIMLGVSTGEVAECWPIIAGSEDEPGWEKSVLVDRQGSRAKGLHPGDYWHYNLLQVLINAYGQALEPLVPMTQVGAWLQGTDVPTLRICKEKAEHTEVK